MRNLIFLGTLLVAALALPAHAGWSVYEHGTRDQLDWHDNHGQSLELASPAGKSIEVVDITPAGRYGLRKGDVITAVDGHATAHVGDLTAYANTHRQDATKLAVHRGHDDIQLTLAAGELASLMYPHP